MKSESKQASSLILILIVTFTAVSFLLLQNKVNQDPKEKKPLYVGVAFQGNTTNEAKLLIDRVKDYTNLFVVGSSPVSRNESMMTNVCDYAVAAGLNIIVNFGYYDPFVSSDEEAFRRWPWQHSWVEAAESKYGDRILGVYYDDEPGGITLDWDWEEFFSEYSSYFSGSGNTTLHKIYAKLIAANASGIEPGDYNLEASYFAELLGLTFDHTNEEPPEITTFTSDYTLYWFDYLGGYDVILAQLGWNHTYVQDIALVRGAARQQEKKWGVIATWKYDEPPYLDSGKEIYKQMVGAYQAGATYIMIFNYPGLEGNVYGVMQDEHFLALEQFWKNVAASNVRTVPDLREADVALVLPRNYGWGMRTIDDRIWGMWGSDSKSPQIWSISRKLLMKYGLRLDIVYDDAAFPVVGKYNLVYYWNGSI
ncbi:MAG TPA: hypothetical protein VF893_07500 [Candidatus Bathyarchaeia archaeon]